MRRFGTISCAGSEQSKMHMIDVVVSTGILTQQNSMHLLHVLFPFFSLGSEGLLKSMFKTYLGFNTLLNISGLNCIHSVIDLLFFIIKYSSITFIL